MVKSNYNQIIKIARLKLAAVQEEYNDFLQKNPEAKTHLQAGTERVQ